MISYEELFITAEDTIRMAMGRLTETSGKTLMVVNDDKKLLGTVTDGDIRRWILQERQLDSSVEHIMNKLPIVASETDTIDKIKQLILEHRVEGIPMVDVSGRVVKVHTFEDVLSDSDIHLVRQKVDTPVVIMAGGEGDRLKPFTYILPKPLIPVGDKPIIEKIMNGFHAFGAEEFFVTVNYKAEMIRAYFSEYSQPYSINLVKEDEPLGTAGSIRLLSGKLDRTFFITNCDIVINADYSEMVKTHRQEKNMVTMVCSMKNFKIPYGVVYHENSGTFKDMKEKPEFDFLVNAGLYLMEPEVMEFIPSGERVDMNELISSLHSKGHKIGIYPISENSWFDVGQWEEYQRSADKLKS